MKKVKINNISAVIHTPSGESTKLAILLPGYLDSKDYPHLVTLAEDLMTTGYTSVRIDPTGTWESGDNIENFTVDNQLKDIENVIEYMQAQNKYSEIILGGHSRGGFISILYALKDPRISSVFAIMSPFAIVRTADREKIMRWKEDGFRTSKRQTPDGTAEKEFKVPYSVFEDQIIPNLIRNISDLHIPLLFIAGEFDDVVPPEDVKKLYDSANQPKNYMMIKGINHDYRQSEHAIRLVNTEIINWLKK